MEEFKGCTSREVEELTHAEVLGYLPNHPPTASYPTIQGSLVLNHLDYFAGIGCRSDFNEMIRLHIANEESLLENRSTSDI